MESTTYDKFISELIKQKLLKREDLRDPELVDELKTMYRGQALGKRESVNESDYQIRPALKKLKSSLKDTDVVFTIDDEKLDQMVNSRFSSQLDYQEVDGDSYYILNQRDFDRLIDLADSSGFDVDYENSEDSVLFIYENVNENHISEPYIFQVGDIVRNVNPQCNHYGSTGIVNAIQALDGDMGNIVKYIVTNFGDTFKPGMTLMKTPDQLELMDDINESGSINEYGATPSKKNWLGWFVLNANLHGDLTHWKKGELIKAYKSDEKGYVFIYTGDYNYEAYDDIAQSDFNRIATSLDPTKHKKSYNYVKKLEKLNRLKDYEVIN
jgi:hypothetical protein